MKRLRSVAIPSLLSLLVITLLLLPMEGCRATRRTFYNLTHHRKAKSKANTTDYADNVEDVVTSNQLAIMKWSNFSDYQNEVEQFYDDRSYELAWVRDGKPTAAASVLIDLFENAQRKGLVPDDYDAARWPQRLQRLETIRKAKDTSDNAQTQVAQFDAAMTITTMRFLSDLHVGRVNPQSLNFDIDVPSKRAAFNVGELLNDQLVDSENATSVVESVEPQNPLYKATEEALGRYLMLAQQQAAQPQPYAVVNNPFSAVPRLHLEGDLPAGDVGQPSEGLAIDIAAAVKKFQARHGLSVDGKLSQKTVDELNTPLTARIQQFDLSLERWRWLPDNFVQPRVFVNLPEFLVRTYDDSHTLQFKMKVVDGESNGHDTPIFVRTMRYLIFRPYWNLPTSIIKKELMRHVNSGGQGYLDSHGYEVTTRNGEVVTGWTASDIEHGKYAVRQQPGPKNSLGLVKFMFPNEYDVYMHSTPEMNLFNLARRDRSHGCIRLNDAEAMANWVLQGQGDWDAAKVHDAMFGTNDNKTVGLKNPLPVVITYLTANADEDGTVHFFDDVYGYDKQLAEALAKPRPYDKAPHKIDPKLIAGETE